VQLLTSPQLQTAWYRLDRFEGPGYRRVVTEVSLAAGSVSAQIYELADRPPSSDAHRQHDRP